MYADVLKVKDDYVAISQHHALFDEHFPKFSVLPGAFSIVCCANCITQKLNEDNLNKYSLSKIKKVSFLKPIKPGAKVKVKLIKIMKINETKLVTFSLEDEANLAYLKGQLLFGEKL